MTHCSCRVARHCRRQGRLYEQHSGQTLCFNQSSGTANQGRMLLTAASHHDYPGRHLECFDLKRKRKKKIIECEKEREGKGWFEKRRNGGSLSIDNGLCFSGGVTPNLGSTGPYLGNSES